MTNCTMVLNVLYRDSEGKVSGVVLVAHDYAFFDGAMEHLATTYPEPEAAKNAVAALTRLENGEIFHGLEKHGPVQYDTVVEALTESPTTEAGQVELLLYGEQEAEWLSDLWKQGEEISLHSVADFHGYPVSAAKLATRGSLEEVRAKQAIPGNWMVLNDALFLYSKDNRDYHQDSLGYESHPAVAWPCDWWNGQAPAAMRNAAYFRLYIWDETKRVFVSGDPEEPPMKVAEFVELSTFSLFEETGMPPVALLFFKGRKFNTEDQGYTRIYFANGEDAWEIGLGVAEIDEALYTVRGFETLKHWIEHQAQNR